MVLIGLPIGTEGGIQMRESHLEVVVWMVISLYSIREDVGEVLR